MPTSTPSPPSFLSPRQLPAGDWLKYGTEGEVTGPLAYFGSSQSATRASVCWRKPKD